MDDGRDPLRCGQYEVYKTDTHAITGWRVNGVTYAPGEKVEINGAVTVTAVVTVTEGTEVAESSTATYYDWDFTNDNPDTTTNTGYTLWDKSTSTADVIGNTGNTTPFGGTW